MVNSFQRILVNNISLDIFIKIIEYARGLYRYPRKMIGRIIPSHINTNTDILVIAAHPDDEVLGLSSTISKHRMNGEKVTIVYVTNGSGGNGPSWRRKKEISRNISNVRYVEGVKALSLVGITRSDIFCLGYPDAGTHRYINQIAKDVQYLLMGLSPKRVYVHCIEGGHGDHDITSFVVKSVCNSLGFTSIYEWAEYNNLQPLGSTNVSFSNSRQTANNEEIIKLSKEQYSLKKRMLEYHKSQGVEKHYLMGEAIRKARTDNVTNELIDFSSYPKDRLKPIIRKLKV